MSDSTMEAIVHPAGESGQETVLRVNFGLSWAAILKGFTVMGGAIAALHAAGWLQVPASQAALNDVTVQLVETNKQVRELQVVVRELTGAVGALQGSVNRMARQPERRRR